MFAEVRGDQESRSRPPVLYRSMMNQFVTFTQDEVDAEDFAYPHPLIRIADPDQNDFIGCLTLTEQDPAQPETFREKFEDFMKVLYQQGLGEQAAKVVMQWKEKRDGYEEEGKSQSLPELGEVPGLVK